MGEDTIGADAAIAFLAIPVLLYALVWAVGAVEVAVDTFRRWLDGQA